MRIVEAFLIFKLFQFGVRWKTRFQRVYEGRRKA